jgi:hypothetical protein
LLGHEQKNGPKEGKAEGLGEKGFDQFEKSSSKRIQT